MKIILSEDRSFVPSGHEDPLDPGVVKKVLFQKEDLQVGRVQMVNWARLRARRHFEAHYHEDMQEFFIILTGTADITVGSQKVTLKPGDTVLMEPGEIHHMYNPGEQDMDYLAVGISRGNNGRTVRVPGPEKPVS